MYEIIPLSRLLWRVRNGYHNGVFLGDDSAVYGALSSWTESEKCQLLQNVARGFPLGNFLLWEAPRGYRRALPTFSYGENYVLDGNQRIAILLEALTESPFDSCFVYDLHSREVRLSRRSCIEFPCIPFSCLLQTEKFRAQLQEYNPHDVMRANRLADTFINVQVLTTKLVGFGAIEVADFLDSRGIYSDSKFDLIQSLRCE